MTRSTPLRLFFGAAVMLAIAAPSCIPASAPTAAGTFIACYKESGGAVRFVNEGETCDQGERQATWNQTGPQGPAGPQGATGPAGPTGANGAGPAYKATGTPPSNIPVSGQVTIRSMTLPAGKYKMDFSAYIGRISGTGNSTALCFLSPSISAGAYVSSASLTDLASIAFSTLIELTGPTLVTVKCQANQQSGSNAAYLIESPELIATQVTNIIPL